MFTRLFQRDFSWKEMSKGHRDVVCSAPGIPTETKFHCSTIYNEPDNSLRHIIYCQPVLVLLHTGIKMINICWLFESNQTSNPAGRTQSRELDIFFAFGSMEGPLECSIYLILRRFCLRQHGKGLFFPPPFRRRRKGGGKRRQSTALPKAKRRGNQITAYVLSRYNTNLTAPFRIRWFVLRLLIRPRDVPWNEMSRGA